MWRLRLIWGLTLTLLLLSSCGDDDLKKVEAISAKKVVLTKDRTLGADIIYSDSAVVKAKGFAPVLDRYTESGNNYQEMPEGVKIDFYEQSRIKGSISSEYAIRRENEKTMLFKKNVIVTYPEGRYTCEELTWDETRKKYFSPSGILTKTDGSVLSAKDFDATQDFKVVNMSSVSAETYTKKPVGDQ